MQNNPRREDLVTEIADVINQIKLPHPVRVAIDGGGNAGKTTFANEIEQALLLLNRKVIRSTIDGFHNPPEIRRKQGQYSPKGYFEDSYNYPKLKNVLLEQLGPNGNLEYKESFYDFRVSRETNVQTKKADLNSILLFDGIFLFNEHLFTYWDYKLFIDTSFEQTTNRAIVRDSDLFGGKEKVIKIYKERYIPGQELYLKKHNPTKVSDIVLNNNDYLRPRVTKISSSKLHNDLFHIRNSFDNS